MTPLAQWAVKNYTPEVRNVGLKHGFGKTTAHRGYKMHARNGVFDREKSLVKTRLKRFCPQKSGFAKVKIVCGKGGFGCQRRGENAECWSGGVVGLEMKTDSFARRSRRLTQIQKRRVLTER